jgi:hypothetical protein
MVDLDLRDFFLTKANVPVGESGLGRTPKVKDNFDQRANIGSRAQGFGNAHRKNADEGVEVIDYLFVWSYQLCSTPSGASTIRSRIHIPRFPVVWLTGRLSQSRAQALPRGQREFSPLHRMTLRAQTQVLPGFPPAQHRMKAPT